MSLFEWYRCGHLTVLDARRRLLWDYEMSPEDFSRGLRTINSVERYLLRQMRDDER